MDTATAVTWAAAAGAIIIMAGAESADTITAGAINAATEDWLMSPGAAFIEPLP